MRRLIFLYIDLEQIPDDVPQSKWKSYQTKMAQQAVKDFTQQVKALKSVKIVEDNLPRPEVLIQFPDEQRDVVYEALRQLPIVETIDSMVPQEK